MKGSASSIPLIEEYNPKKEEDLKSNKSEKFARNLKKSYLKSNKQARNDDNGGEFDIKLRAEENFLSSVSTRALGKKEPIWGTCLRFSQVGEVTAILIKIHLPRSVTIEDIILSPSEVSISLFSLDHF